MSAHTPTPWRWIGGPDGAAIDPLTFESEQTYCDNPQLVSSDSTVVVHAGRGEYDPVPNVFDKTFIVQACNAHDDLVALRDAVAEWKRVVFKGVGPEVEACWSRVCAALTKVGAV